MIPDFLEYLALKTDIDCLVKVYKFNIALCNLVTRISIALVEEMNFYIITL